MGGGSNTPLSSQYPQLAVRPVGKQIEHIYTDRLRQFLDDGQYREQGLKSKLINKFTNESKYIKVLQKTAFCELSTS